MEKGGRRPPFIGPHESNRWQPTNHGTTAQRAVLPWSGTTSTGAVLPLYGTTGLSTVPTTAPYRRFCGSRSGSSHGTTAGRYYRSSGRYYRSSGRYYLT